MGDWLLLISIVLIVAILAVLQGQVFTAKKQAKPGQFLGRLWLRWAAILAILLIWISFYFGKVEVPSMVKVISMLGLGVVLLLAEIFDMKFLYPRWRDLRRRRFLGKLETRISRLLARKPESYREQDELVYLHQEVI